MALAMLLRLENQVKRISAEGLSAADVYRRAERRLPRRAMAPGLLRCPICGRSAARFLPFGLGGRRNARCPSCGSLERHRLLWLYLTRHTRLLCRSARMLHTAPEPCLAARLRARPNLRYRSLDLFAPDADIQADLGGLPFEDGALDLVLSSHVLEHLPDDRPALSELARVLPRGGRAIIMVPYDPALDTTEEGGHLGSPAERLARFGHPFHYRNYGADLPGRFASAGFAVRPVHAKQLLSPHQRRCLRINGNSLFDCTRR